MIKNDQVPFLDLVGLHAELKDELTEVFQRVLDTAGFIGGPMVQSFEEDFARYCDTQHCVGVGSGTDALRFALMAAGVRDGDVVITVPNTFIATTEAITQAGARPAFVDIDKLTYNMDVDKLTEFVELQCTFDAPAGKLFERKTGKPVTAIVPVHLYGQMADMDPIFEIAQKYNLIVIEDSCQAHGAEYYSKKQNRWCRAGSMGRASAFSFYPGKNLGACGEAGAVTTDDASVAQAIRILRDHGQARKYVHETEGYNGRLDAIQAGILRVKLRHLSQWNEQRRSIACIYDKLFSEAKGVVVPPYVPSYSRPVYHLYVVRASEREALIKKLAAAGIGTGIHYPIPLHLSAAYEALGFRIGDFPVAEKAAAEVLSLPMFPGLNAARQFRVVSELLQLLGVEVTTVMQ